MKQTYRVPFPTGRCAYVTAGSDDEAFTRAQDTLPDVPVPVSGPVTAVPALDSQAHFEAMFSYAPRVDTRSPADIRNGVRL